MRRRRLARSCAWLLTAHTALNALLLRRPSAAALVRDPVTVLVPARDEEARIETCLTSILSQRGVADLRLLVLDDASRDGTAAAARACLGGDRRAQLLVGRGDPPTGWLGKPWACQRLADAAGVRRGVVVFIDADVVLAPDALARTVRTLREHRFGFVSPYPRQLTGSVAERLVQPLLQWSWLTFLPLRLAERARQPSLAVANGQLLAVDAVTYAAVGGHAAVCDRVIEDVALARAFRRQGVPGGLVDGTELAQCRMYRGWLELRDGYGKSLWAAAGGRLAGSLAQVALLVWLYAWPDPVSYAAGVTSRLVAAARTGGRPLADAPAHLAHPLAMLVLAGLTGHSWLARRRGQLTWKGRSISLSYGGYRAGSSPLVGRT